MALNFWQDTSVNWKAFQMTTSKFVKIMAIVCKVNDDYYWNLKLWSIFLTLFIYHIFLYVPHLLFPSCDTFNVVLQYKNDLWTSMVSKPSTGTVCIHTVYYRVFCGV